MMTRAALMVAMMTVFDVLCEAGRALSPLSAEERRNPLLHYFHITPMRGGGRRCVDKYSVFLVDIGRFVVFVMYS